MLSFNGLGFLLLYILMRLQAWLPLNPQGFAAVPPDLAFNTAISFVSNTNWQAYAGESTMSHLVQMAGLTVQNFLSAATGIALALTRAFARGSVATHGNFWIDVTAGYTVRGAAFGGRPGNHLCAEQRTANAFGKH